MRLARPVVALVALVMLLPACGGGSGGGVLPATPLGSFEASPTAAAADLVRMIPGAATGDLVTVVIAISGPTTSSDLYSFAFDLELSDPSVARYVSGSASFGEALTLGAGQGSTVQAAISGDHVVVGVSKTGGGPGNAIPAAEQTLVSLTFRLLRAGSTRLTLGGAPGAAPAALDSSGAVVASVVFDAASATLTGV